MEATSTFEIHYFISVFGVVLKWYLYIYSFYFLLIVILSAFTVKLGCSRYLAHFVSNIFRVSRSKFTSITRVRVKYLHFDAAAMLHQARVRVPSSSRPRLGTSSRFFFFITPGRLILSSPRRA